MGYVLTAEQGGWKACYELGWCHVPGRGVEQSAGTSIHWFNQAEWIGTAPKRTERYS